MNRTFILGTGSYLPQKVLSNEDLSQRVDTTDEWILTRTGIRERRIVSKGETCSDLAYHASIRALEAAHQTPKDIDMIILATMTGDQRLPSSSFLLQHKLKATRASVFDIGVACSGFVFGLSIADQFIKTGAMKQVLVVGAEVMSGIIDWTDRSTCVLFGDGGGAALLGALPLVNEKQGHELLSTHLFSNGSLYSLLEIHGGGTADDWTYESLERKDHLVKMKGKEVFREAVESMTEASQIALHSAGLTMDEISIFIPHQANDRIVKAIAKKLNCPHDKIFVNLDKYGNTSAASIPVALDEAVRQAKVKKGDLILLATFGAGFAWGSAIIRW